MQTRMKPDLRGRHQDEDDDRKIRERVEVEDEPGMNTDGDTVVAEEERRTSSEVAGSGKALQPEEPLSISGTTKVSDDNPSVTSSGSSTPAPNPLKQEQAEPLPNGLVGPDERQTRDTSSSRSPTPALIVPDLAVGMSKKSPKALTSDKMLNDAQPGSLNMSVDLQPTGLSGLDVPFELKREDSGILSDEVGVKDVPCPTGEPGRNVVDMDRLMNSIEITKVRLHPIQDQWGSIVG